jgi:hypothetical protein
MRRRRTQSLSHLVGQGTFGVAFGLQPSSLGSGILEFTKSSEVVKP